MKFRSGLVEYFNESSTAKNFNPGLQSAHAGTDRESRPYQTDRTFKNYIKTATSKPIFFFYLQINFQATHQAFVGLYLQALMF